MENPQADNVPNVRPLTFADPLADELLKYSLRTQLESLFKTEMTIQQRQHQLQQSFVEAITLVLADKSAKHQRLVAAFEQMYESATQSMALAELSQELLTRQYVSSSGLIMSPLNCRHTIKDVYRIQGYVRGIDLAIKQQLRQKSVVNVLYPACGPFAPLLLPLLKYYQQQGQIKAGQLKVTLLDIQAGAILSLRQLVSDLEITDYICDIVEQDATEYIPEQSIDLLILEAMQHGFTQEGQLSIAKHLVHYLDLEGSLIPQQVSVRGIMVIGETEFSQQWRTAAFTHSLNVDPTAQADRIELGEIFRVNKSSLLKAQPIALDGGIKVLTANQLTIPKGIEDMSQRIMAIYAHVHTYGQETVQQYDSGITHPRPDMSFYIDAQPNQIDHPYFVANSGDTVQFFYQLTGLPGFIASKL
ncbi:hypothetical protein ACRRS0_13065 [Agarivorans sp. QJM3NY_29]|uniref:hypothetical protein n=1 Tax=unclassified Agarivorans TaxID=2636026 RepID=UPI003D7E31C8